MAQTNPPALIQESLEDPASSKLQFSSSLTLNSNSHSSFCSLVLFQACLICGRVTYRAGACILAEPTSGIARWNAGKPEQTCTISKKTEDRNAHMSAALSMNIPYNRCIVVVDLEDSQGLQAKL